MRAILRGDDSLKLRQMKIVTVVKSGRFVKYRNNDRIKSTKKV